MDNSATNATDNEVRCVKCNHSDGVDINGQCKSLFCGLGCIDDTHPCDCVCEYPAEQSSEVQVTSKDGE